MIEVLPFFPELDKRLIDLLSGLNTAQWSSKTVCSQWKVKDITAHLLDGSLKRLSAGRDGMITQTDSINSTSELLDFINRQNKMWVDAADRLSSNILIELLSKYQTSVYDYFKNLDPHGAALYPVSWAGDEISENWFDIGREYTERWLHQEQIRLAVGAESLVSTHLYKPFLELSMMALPFHFMDVDASENTVVHVQIVGSDESVWRIRKTGSAWILDASEKEPDTSVFVDKNVAWLLLSKGIDIQEAKQYWQVIGDQELGRHVLTMHTFIV